MDALTRIKVRLSGDEEIPTDAELEEILATITDRVCAILRVQELPQMAQSIVVDASVKAVRRKWYEGISSESGGQTGSITTAFYENLLAEYADELAGMRSMLASDGSCPVLRFI